MCALPKKFLTVAVRGEGQHGAHGVCVPCVPRGTHAFLPQAGRGDKRAAGQEGGHVRVAAGRARTHGRGEGG